MLSVSKTIIAFLALTTAAVAYSDSSLYAREADSEYDPVGHIYARDLEVRDAQIRADLEATLRIRELAAHDPETLDLYRREPFWKGAAALAGGFAAYKGIKHFFGKKGGHEGGHEGGAPQEGGYQRRWLAEEEELDFDY